MRMLSVQARNVKGLRLVEFQPNKTATLIGGKNRAGKSSLLDAICMALGGKKLVPAKPLREGEDSGEVTVTLSGDPSRGTQDMIVKRTFVRLASGEVETELTITSTDGFLAGSPQKMLDEFIGRIGFDPLAFMRLEPKKQREWLINLLGLDLSALDQERAKYYATRHNIGQQGEEASGALSNIPAPVPGTKEEDAVDVAEERKKFERLRADRDGVLQNQSSLQATIKASHSREKSQIDLIKKLSDQLEQLQSSIKMHSEALQEQVACRDRFEKELATIVVPDIGAAEADLNSKLEINKNVELLKRRAAQQSRVEELRLKYKELSTKITDVDARKAQAIAAAPCPLPGLGFADDGVVFNGLPLEQACTSDQTKVSVAIGAAAGKELNVMFVREGSLLDEEHLVEIANIAAERGCQMLVERVGEGDENNIVLRDGEVFRRDTDQDGQHPVEEAVASDAG